MFLLGLSDVTLPHGALLYSIDIYVQFFCWEFVITWGFIG